MKEKSHGLVYNLQFKSAHTPYNLKSGQLKTLPFQPNITRLRP